MMKILYKFTQILSIFILIFGFAPPTSVGATANSGENSSEFSSPPENSLQNPAALQIFALNPGYTIDGKRDVGEFIELTSTSTTFPTSLANYSLRYTNTSNNQITLYDFSANAELVGPTVILRLARTAPENSFDATYSTSLALAAGPLELLYDSQVVDQVCWTGQDSCADAFKSAAPTSLVRDGDDWQHQTDYSPTYDLAHPGLQLPATPAPSEPDEDEESVATNCNLLYFSELHSYYATAKSEQFIELYNPSDETVLLDGCQLRYKNKTYPINGQISPGAYFVFYPVIQNLTLTKNPSSSNKIELLDANHKVVDFLNYPHGQKKSTSFAMVYDQNGEEQWLQTYALTPGSSNVYQEFRNCPEGKIINPATGNCVKTTTTTTTVCGEGKYLNPLTGRCKTIEDNSVKACAEGYERNPETGRCRKITKANQGAEYAITPITYSDQTTFIAAGVVALILGASLIYIVWQFRPEIQKLFRKLRQRFHYIRKNLLARARRRNRNKKS